MDHPRNCDNHCNSSMWQSLQRFYVTITAKIMWQSPQRLCVAITKGTNYVTITPQQYVTIARDNMCKSQSHGDAAVAFGSRPPPKRKTQSTATQCWNWKTKTELRRTTISTYTCSLTELTNSFDRPTGGLHVAPSITPSFGGAHLTPSIGELQPPTVAVAMRKPTLWGGYTPTPSLGHYPPCWQGW